MKRHVAFSRGTTAIRSAVALALACSLGLLASSAGADQPATGYSKAARTKRDPLPVRVSVSAPSPDPPWVLRVENVSDVPVRIPADALLLRFDMKIKKGAGAKRCSLPASMVPSGFPEKRELYLRPGEVYEEQIDPRMYCFGEGMTDYLRPGTSLVPRFGFGSGLASREPFVAQSADDADSYLPLRDLTGPEIVLPNVPEGSPTIPPASGPFTPKPPAPPPPPTAGAKPHANGTASHDGSEAEEEEEQAPVVTSPPPVVDMKAGHLDIYVERLVDAAAPRDVILTIRAKNEGRRKLAAVLRGRMLHFHVEELAADNRPLREVDCVHQASAHGIATEMVSEVQPGREMRIPLVISEICPRGTFTRPGMYRITPRLDTAQMGESLKKDAWLGQTFARQSALVRLASGPQPFHYASPRSGPVKLAPGEMLVAVDAAKVIKSDKTPPIRPVFSAPAPAPTPKPAPPLPEKEPSAPEPKKQ